MDKLKALGLALLRNKAAVAAILGAAAGALGLALTPDSADKITALALAVIEALAGTQ